MNNKKKLLTYCPNYYNIINYELIEGDTISYQIIRIYKSFVAKINSNNSDELEKLKQLDQIIFKYIHDYSFRKEFQKEMKNIRVDANTKDLLNDFIKYFIKIFNNYEEFTTRNIYISRWI